MLSRRFNKVFFWLLFMITTTPSYGQYFGQNKVMYEFFNFDIYESPHFQIYNYIENDTLIHYFGQQSERWYLRHFTIFNDSLHNSPIILYNDHADFKQTSVISGMIGVGTGGVTEGFRSRVVMPFLASNRETDHVLGHEMVHVFQYNLVREDDSLGFQSLMNTPLWMIEGMAEYLSIGPSDNRTSMWMRDAIINDDFPSIKQMTRNPYKYFPYRYGHAFWAFVTGIWGDEIIKPLLYRTLQVGPERAFKSMLHMDADSLSSIWKTFTFNHYKPFISDTISPPGNEIFGFENAGTTNLSPVISPDGKYMTFLSNRDVISIDILLAETETKNIVKKLTTTIRKTHIDDFNYIESSGSWSPDGKKYTLTSFSKGTNNLLIVEVDRFRAKTIEETKIEGLDAFSNPEWSPDGSSILMTGLVNGQSDLYLYNLNTREIQKLTDDLYSDVHPGWSSDGSKIVFISDRGEDTDLSKQIYGTYKLCVMDLKTNQIDLHDILPQSDILSPQFSPKDTAIFFISNFDGYRNLYRYNLQNEKIYKLTKLATGITGITDLAPAYSVARKTGEIAYTLYHDDGYVIYKANPEDFLNIEINPADYNFAAAQLPPGDHRILDLVSNGLALHPSQPVDSFQNEPYNPQFELEYLGASGVGVGVSTSVYGNYASGGVSALWGDMLKHHQIYSMLQINGEIYDIGGQLAYINLKKRVNYGASYSHIPYRYSYFYYPYVGQEISEQGDTTEYINSVHIQNRIFVDNLSFFGQFPLSTKLRFEAGVSYSRYSYRVDSINNFVGGKYGQSKHKIDAPDPFNLGRAYIALVGDNATYGVTSPLNGYRYRIQVERLFDSYSINEITLDFRKYFYFKPLGIAIRAMHWGNYSTDANKIYPYYVGYEYFVHGYSLGTLSNTSTAANKLSSDNVYGSKIIVGNFEVRYPFTGPRRLSLIKSDYFYSDLVLFFDGALTWYNNYFWNDASRVKISWEPVEGHQIPIFSSGIALRINLFGYAILEPYVALPFQNPTKDYVFGFSISGGGW